MPCGSDFSRRLRVSVRGQRALGVRRAATLLSLFFLLACKNSPAPPRPAELALQSAAQELTRAKQAVDAKKAELAQARRQWRELASALTRVHADETPFIWVDIDHRRVVYYEAGRLAKVCEASVGSGRIVTNDSRDWKFDTPRGAYRVLGKIKDPIWRKPDWAFIEKHEPIPPYGSPLREEKGAMGPYALDLGDGYKLHGTREEGRIGDPVSHGCVRLETECITYLYQHVPVGTPVLMY